MNRGVVARRIGFALVLALLLAAAVAVYIRVNTWACGRFDDQSGCVSSVKLNVRALGLASGSVELNRRSSFDLSAGAERVLVGMRGLRDESEGSKRYTAVVALFNTQDGGVIRVLRELRGDYAGTAEVALSPDGSLVASYAWGEAENSLIVQRSAGGSLVTTIFELDGDEVYDCAGELAFSQDNRSLQCGSEVYDLATGSRTPLSKYGDLLADFSLDNTTRIRLSFPDYSERAFVGRARRRKTLLSDTVISRESHAFVNASSTARLPSIFRRGSGVTFWSFKGETHTPTSFANYKRYVGVAWSRDSRYLGVLYEDLSLQVFDVKAP